jgi:hypothetical protein
MTSLPIGTTGVSENGQGVSGTNYFRNQSRSRCVPTIERWSVFDPA